MPRTAATNRSAASNRLKVLDVKSSLSFNGTSSGVAATSVARTTGQPIVFGCRVKVFNKNCTIMGARSGSGAGQVSKIGVNSSGLFQLDYDTTGSGSQPASTITANDGRWHSVVGRYDGSNIILYVDGVQAAITASKPNAALSATTFAYGKRADNSSEYMLGSICDGFNSTSDWTASEILNWSLYGTLPSGKTMVFQHPLQEGAGTTAYDSSGNGNNGTITNGTFTSDVPTRKRGVVGGNLVYNGDFSYYPVVNVAMTSSAPTLGIDGTAGGSSTNNLFGWATRAQAGTTAIKFDTSELYNGNPTMKLSAVSAGAQVGLQTAAPIHPITSNYKSIPAAPGTSYTLSGMMKTNLVSGDATSGANIAAYQRDGTGALNPTNGTTRVRTTTDWTYYTVTFTTAATTRFIQVVLEVKGNDGAATLIMDAWFADITLTPTTNTTRGVVS